MTTRTDHEKDLCRRCAKSFGFNVHSIGLRRCDPVKLDTATLEFLSKTSWDFLCADCLREIDNKVIALKRESPPHASALQDGVHYYIENGLWVFTEYYHMLRGHCCKSGCRHCPYGFRKQNTI